MIFRRIFITFVLLIGIIQPLFAVWVGKGEIEGEVKDSWIDNNRVIFRLTITNQKLEQGPRLGGPDNWFSFNGQDRLEITKGDIVKLKVNSSDEYGIKVEQVVFIVNNSGSPEQSFNNWWLALPLVLITAVVVFFLFRVPRSKSGNY
jgi:hypothetical protein